MVNPNWNPLWTIYKKKFVLSRFSAYTYVINVHDENAEHVLVTYFITQIYLLYDQLMYTFLDDSDDMMALDIWKLFKTIKDQNKTIAANAYLDQLCKLGDFPGRLNLNQEIFQH